MPILAHKIKLLPSKEQEAMFGQAAGVARFAYNWALDECNKTRSETGKNPNIPELKKRFNAIKEIEFPWIYESPKDANQQPFTQLQKAWKRFWDGVKKEGKIPVWNTAQKKKLLGEGTKLSQMSFPPRFKRRKDGSSFYISNDKFSVSKKAVKLPVIGAVPMTEALRFSGKIMAGSVSKEGRHWYLSIQVEVPDHEYQKARVTDGVIGIDLGIKDTAVLSNGEPAFTGPKPLKKALRRVAIRQRRVSRKSKQQRETLGLKGKPTPKGTRLPKSNNQIKAEQSVADVHTRVKNIRRDFQHKLTTKLCSENQAIAIEDLNVSGMMKNRKLSRALSDIGMGEIRRQLTYKAARYGTTLHMVSRWYPSSKTCSDCGWKKEDLELKDRTWVCEECGVVHDRDVNAAINLRNKMLELIPRGHSEIHALPDMNGVTRSGQEPNEI